MLLAMLRKPKIRCFVKVLHLIMFDTSLLLSDAISEFPQCYVLNAFSIIVAEHDEDDADKAIENAEVEQNFRKELTVVELYAEREKAIKESKMSIAVASEEVLENPETNVSVTEQSLFSCIRPLP